MSACQDMCTSLVETRPFEREFGFGTKQLHVRKAYDSGARALAMPGAWAWVCKTDVVALASHTCDCSDRELRQFSAVAHAR